MNLEFFQTMFGAWKGYVYKYLGSLDVENLHAYVTERFANTVGHNLIICTVVEVKPGIVVVYSEDKIEDNSEFQLWFDLLVPSSYVELPPPEETPPEEPPAQ